MDKREKIKFYQILAPKDYIYLTVILTMIIIVGLIGGIEDTKVIIIELVIWVILFVFSVYLNKIKKDKIEKHIENLAFDSTLINNNNLTTFPLPAVTIELDGMIVWYNKLFKEVLEKDNLIERYIFEFIEGIKPDNLLNGSEVKSFNVGISGKSYGVVGNLIKIDNRKENYAIMLYFIENTEYVELQAKYSNEKPCVGITIIDNYDEIMQNVDDSGRQQLLAEIDKKINVWYAFTGGVVKKYERDKYIIFFETKYLSVMEESKFEILDIVKEISLGNKIPVTLSVGISDKNTNFAEGFKNSLGAIELALGRGGDQVVINRSGEYSFFGGKSKELEKRTRVKARVMANALQKLMEQPGNVIIMGHSNPDADAIGAAVGLYRIAQCLNKEANIVINNPDNVAISSLTDKLALSGQYEDVIIDRKEALDRINNETLLIVVDTHRASFTEVPELLEFTKKVVVIDHHRKVTDFIGEAILTYHEIYASSTSELVAELLEYMDKKVVIRQIEAEALYAGIILDTKNFTFKTGIRTFEAAAFLKKYGVDTISVKQMFQSDINIHMAKANVIKNAKIIDNQIAVSICEDEDKANLIAAQSADELLNVTGVKASFVLSVKEDMIYISGRSLGDTNVQIILEKLGGGGSMTMAGAQLKGVSREEAIDRLVTAIKEYTESL